MNNTFLQESVKIGHLNVRSLFNAFTEFADLVVSDTYDVMCVSETWINNDDIADALYIPNYVFFHKDRMSRGGGVGIYVKSNLSGKQVFQDFLPPDGIEQVMVELCIGKRKILLIVLYRVT